MADERERAVGTEVQAVDEARQGFTTLTGPPIPHEGPDLVDVGDRTVGCAVERAVVADRPCDRERADAQREHPAGERRELLPRPRRVRLRADAPEGKNDPTFSNA